MKLVPEFMINRCNNDGYKIGRNSLVIFAWAFILVAYICNTESTTIRICFGLISLMTIAILIYSCITSRLSLRDRCRFILKHKPHILESVNALVIVAGLTICPLLSEPSQIVVSYISLAVAIVACIIVFYIGRNSNY